MLSTIMAIWDLLVNLSWCVSVNLAKDTSIVFGPTIFIRFMPLFDKQEFWVFWLVILSISEICENLQYEFFCFILLFLILIYLKKRHWFSELIIFPWIRYGYKIMKKNIFSRHQIVRLSSSYLRHWLVVLESFDYVPEFQRLIPQKKIILVYLLIQKHLITLIGNHFLMILLYMSFEKWILKEKILFLLVTFLSMIFIYSLIRVNLWLFVERWVLPMWFKDRFLFFGIYIKVLGDFLLSKVNNFYPWLKQIQNIEKFIKF